MSYTSGGSLYKWHTTKWIPFVSKKRRHHSPSSPSKYPWRADGRILTLTLWYESKPLRKKMSLVSPFWQLRDVYKALSLLLPELGQSLWNIFIIWSVINCLLSLLSGQETHFCKIYSESPNSGNIFSTVLQLYNKWVTILSLELTDQSYNTHKKQITRQYMHYDMIY